MQSLSTGNEEEAYNTTALLKSTHEVEERIQEVYRYILNLDLSLLLSLGSAASLSAAATPAHISRTLLPIDCLAQHSCSAEKYVRGGRAHPERPKGGPCHLIYIHAPVMWVL